jgi:hypothetical protein
VLTVLEEEVWLCVAEVLVDAWVWADRVVEVFTDEVNDELGTGWVFARSWIKVTAEVTNSAVAIIARANPFLIDLVMLCRD